MRPHLRTTVHTQALAPIKFVKIDILPFFTTTLNYNIHGELKFNVDNYQPQVVVEITSELWRYDGCTSVVLGSFRVSGNS